MLNEDLQYDDFLENEEEENEFNNNLEEDDSFTYSNNDLHNLDDIDIDIKHEIILQLEIYNSTKTFYLNLELKYLANLDNLLEKYENDLNIYDEYDEENIIENTENTEISNNTIAYLDEVNIRKIKINGKKLTTIDLNENSILEIEKDENNLIFNIKDLFSNLDKKYQPSKTAMQENIIVEEQFINTKIDFNWTENNAEKLEINGTIIIKEI